MALKDLWYAIRSLRRNPVFLITVIGTIALGIGASTAIFSVANAVLLRPLPYRDPDRLVLASAELRKRNIYDNGDSVPNFLDLRNGTKSTFDDLAATIGFRGVFPRADGSPEQVNVAQVTTNFFSVLGVKVIAGRDFNDADGQPQPAPPPGATVQNGPPPLPVMAMISYDYWQRRYGGSAEIFGKPISGAGRGAPQIVGVVEPGFELLLPPAWEQQRAPEMFFALRLAYDNTQRNTYGFRFIGRLKPGVTIDQAQAAAEVVASDVRRGFPNYGTAEYHIRLEPMHQHLVSAVRPAILALMGAVTFLLLIACANVANLLLVRTSLRERELAVRAALGGSRWRLVRQMLIEAALLASGGTILGLALAKLGIVELVAIGPANLPRLDHISIDPVVLMFSILAGLVAASLFGLAPALRASRADVMDVLRSAGRTAALGAGRLRHSVAIVEVALSFVLLIGCGLMVRSFIALQQIDPGYDSNHLLTFQLLGGRGGAQPQERAARMREIQDRLKAIPGVETVIGSTPFPLSGGFSTIRWGKEEALTDPSKFQATDFQIVLPGYFEAIHTPLIAGRTFTDADNAPDRNVAIVDQQFAAKAFPRESAVGKRVLVRQRAPQPEWVEIIGVVAHTRETELAVTGREQVYFTDGYVGHGAIGRWALRSTADPTQLGAAVRAEMKRLDPNLLVHELQPMAALVDRAQAATRFALLLITVFAAIAAVLASVGLYGVLATFVRLRTAEIGVRMAMGAAPGRIFQLVVGQGLRLSAIGIAIGFAVALAFTRIMASMLVGVKPTDAITFLATALLFFVVATLACWIPAWRASRLDPTVALRDE
jgi:putative ABC transport system permease protein